jgi:hypothetical protein
MTTTKTATHAHTPGPWRHNPQTGRVILNGSAVYTIRDRTADLDALPRFNPADVQLMAAAPELLAALRDLAGRLEMVAADIRGGLLKGAFPGDYAAGLQRCAARAAAAIESATRPLRRWSVTALVAEWNPVTGDYDEIDLDHEPRAYDAAEAEYLARDAWSDHGHNPDRVKVRPLD